MATNNATKVVTGEVRLGYVHLFEPYTPDPEEQKAKYSCMLIIPKSTRDGKKTLKDLRAAQEAALEDGKGKFGGKVPRNWTDTLHDGDEEGDLERNPELEDSWYMTVSANPEYPPGVVDRNVKAIMDSQEIYSGVYARVSLVAYAFNTSGNKGVSFGLRHVQKLRDGEFLGGRSNAEDDFDALDDDDDDEDDDGEDDGLI